MARNKYEDQILLNGVPDHVKVKLLTLDTLLEMKKVAYSKLGQIDMLSGEGYQLLKDINQLKGQIKGIEWMITNS